MAYKKQTFIDHEVDLGGNIVTQGTQLKKEHFDHIEEGIASLNRNGVPPLMVVKFEEGSKMTIRCKDWTADRDFVWEFGGVCGTNKTANLWYSSTVDKTLADSALAWGIGNTPSKSQLYKSTTDDTAPMQFCGSYFGGNHAMTGSTDIVVSSHNLTEADIGSTWKDSDASDARQYMLCRIKSATTLTFINLFVQVNKG